MVRQVRLEPVAPLAPGLPEPGWGACCGNTSASFSPSTRPGASTARCAPRPGRRQAGVDMPGGWCVTGVGIRCKNTLVGRLMPAGLVLNTRPTAHAPCGLGRSPHLFETLQNACERTAFTWSAHPVSLPRRAQSKGHLFQ